MTKGIFWVLFNLGIIHNYPISALEISGFSQQNSGLATFLLSHEVYRLRFSIILSSVAGARY